MLDPIVERGSADGVRRRSSKIFAPLSALGVKRGDLDHDPMQGMDAAAKEGKRERVLSEDEILDCVEQARHYDQALPPGDREAPPVNRAACWRSRRDGPAPSST